MASNVGLEVEVNWIECPFEGRCQMTSFEELNF